MTAWDFVVGVLFGSVISCELYFTLSDDKQYAQLIAGFFFVVQNSQGRSIRAIYTGQTAMSTVRRPGAHRAYIREVSRQTTILRLHGTFLL
jgi:SulP family sulfate permease